MKILVTGGAGFIGSHITDEFINDGHEIVIIDNLSTGKKKNINPKAKFYQSDITDPAISEIFKKEKFDVVNHHAAQIDVRKSVANPIFDANTNIIGTLNLLQASVKYGVKKFMFASSGGAAYGEQEYFPADEVHPTNPVSPYGITKLSIEKYLYFYKIEYNLNYTILRYTNVYGPRQNPEGEAGVVAIFTNKLLNNENPVINGTGKQTRDYIFVGDVVSANLKTLSEDGSNIYNVGTGTETDVIQIFNLLNQITGQNAKELYRPQAKGEQMRSVITSKKLMTKFNWQPATKLSDGLKITVESFANKTIKK